MYIKVLHKNKTIPISFLLLLNIYVNRTQNILIKKGMSRSTIIKS